MGTSQFLITCIIAAGFTLPIFIPVCGRWLTAKLCGMKTPILSFGVGTDRWTWILGKFWNTEFRLAPLLFVGYVSIPELYYVPNESTEGAATVDPDKKVETRHFPIWKKLVVNTSAVLSCLLSAWFQEHHNPGQKYRTYLPTPERLPICLPGKHFRQRPIYQFNARLCRSFRPARGGRPEAET